MYVCTGNLCRSVLAEYFFRGRLAEAGRTGVEARSAGVMAMPGVAASPEVLKILRRRGFQTIAHQSRSFSPELMDWADLILTMEIKHQTWLASRFPRSVGKVRVLKSYVDAERPWDIKDPIGQNEKAFEECAAEIDDAVKKLLQKL